MKRIYKSAAVTLTAAAMLLPVSAAENLLSPGLEVIASEQPMVKSGIAGADICFDADDFAEALGVGKVSKITITRLPGSDSGTLKLGALNVEEGQTISAKNLSSLRFVANSGEELETGFGFRVDNRGAQYSCTVFALSSINSAPVLYQPDSIEVGAYSGVSCLGSLKAVDPEGDPLSFEIVSQPSGGSVVLTDRKLGYYVYTPGSDFEGRDSFEVCVTDKYGNRSNTVKVSLTVDKPVEGEIFSDMDGHWANAAVITCVRTGLFSTDENGSFYPDEAVSRAEFLSLIMSAAGYTGFSTSNTGFADDADIPSEYKGCIAAAEALGVISGIDSESGRLFCPNNRITRAEAAVMLSRLTGIGTGGEALAVFADDSVPTWARSAMSALNAEGILRGDGSSLAPYEVVTRAAAAQLAASLIAR